MKNRKISLIIAVALILSLVLASTQVYAKVAPRTVGTLTIGFSKTSATSATATVMGSTTGTASYIKTTLTLQSSTNGTSWSDVTGTANTKTVYNTNIIDHQKSFSINSSGLKYRVKVVIEDSVNNRVTIETRYSNSI